MCFALDVLLNHWFVCFLLVWLLKCAKLAKPELVPAFMLGGAAKMSPPKSLRRSNLLSWNCCWWVCPRLTTGDWWRQEIDWKKELQVCVEQHVFYVHCLYGSWPTLTQTLKKTSWPVICSTLAIIDAETNIAGNDPKFIISVFICLNKAHLIGWGVLVEV